METVVKNLDTMIDEHSKNILEKLEQWKTQYTGQLMNVITESKQSPEMFTNRYGELTDGVDGQEFIEIKKQFKNDEWIICGGIENHMYGGSSMDLWIIISNYGSIYTNQNSELERMSGRITEVKYNLYYGGNLKLPNDYIDFIKIITECHFCHIIPNYVTKELWCEFIKRNIFEFKCDYRYNENGQDLLINNKEMLFEKSNSLCEHTFGHTVTGRTDNHNQVTIHREMSCGGKTRKRVCNGINLNGPIGSLHISDNIGMSTMSAFTKMMYLIIQTICNKYWNRNCVGQEALKIKQENDELKEKYDQFVVDREQLDNDVILFTRERMEFDRQREDFSDVSGLTKLENEREQLRHEKEQFESETGLEFIRSEKERLKRVKEQLCNMKSIITQERKKLEEDIRMFEEKKKETMSDLDNVDI